FKSISFMIKIKGIIVFAFCAASSMVSAQPEIEYELQSNVKKQLLTYYFDFDSTKVSAQGYVSSEEFSDLGKKMGEWKYYYENGNLKEVANYVRGYVNGRVIQYYPNGQKKNLGYYYWGVQDSTFQSWSP